MNTKQTPLNFRYRPLGVNNLPIFVVSSKPVSELVQRSNTHTRNKWVPARGSTGSNVNANKTRHFRASPREQESDISLNVRALADEAQLPRLICTIVNAKHTHVLCLVTLIYESLQPVSWRETLVGCWNVNSKAQQIFPFNFWGDFTKPPVIPQLASIWTSCWLMVFHHVLSCQISQQSISEPAC